MFGKILQIIFGKRKHFTEQDKFLPNTPIDISKITGNDFEFLLTPSDLEIEENNFDNLMTPDSISWTKISKDGWNYYQVGEDEFYYSWELPGIQMCFNNEITYSKAKQIADEVAVKLTLHCSKKVEVQCISKNKVIRFG